MIGRGIPPAQAIIAFESTELVERFVRDSLALAGGRGGVSASVGDASSRAHLLFDAIMSLKHRGEIVGDRDNSPKQRLPKTADGVLAARHRASSERVAGCYELTVLYVAAGRAAGLDAFGVAPSVLDGTGQIGHMMAGVRVSKNQPVLVFDLQNERLENATSVRELSDLEFAAHHFNHLGVSAFLGGQAEVALHYVEWALGMAADNPSFLSNRAAILVALGEPVLAIAEAAFAAELAPAVPHFRFQLGRAHLVAGHLQDAIVCFRQALLLDPTFVQARRDLGWALLLGGDADGAQRQLGQTGVEPDSYRYRSLFYAVMDDPDAVRAEVERGLAHHPQDKALRDLLDAIDKTAPPWVGLRFKDVVEAARKTRRGERGPPLLLP
ncbi:MAG: hypothetical protein A2289_14265 [Deltaproteobacteria bacterium RIFOXYA12_FULL_58_15]|nr:MAG: hypothetical protein A2289_14265 [Deltaproteobacteria bacterium RIFOXYA12_FULL_58_15]OGR14445.1 MAG: hypothetical protein A2341_20595 [Deltaproteobacteria bacterium RIFOXYB12_FULL_58_9]